MSIERQITAKERLGRSVAIAATAVVTGPLAGIAFDQLTSFSNGEVQPGHSLVLSNPVRSLKDFLQPIAEAASEPNTIPINIDMTYFQDRNGDGEYQPSERTKPAPSHQALVTTNSGFKTLLTSDAEGAATVNIPCRPGQRINVTLDDISAQQGGEPVGPKTEQTKPLTCNSGFWDPIFAYKEAKEAAVTVTPTTTPIVSPSVTPTSVPSVTPSRTPEPTTNPTVSPSVTPSATPTIPGPGRGGEPTAPDWIIPLLAGGALAAISAAAIINRGRIGHFLTNRGTNRLQVRRHGDTIEVDFTVEHRVNINAPRQVADFDATTRIRPHH